MRLGIDLMGSESSPYSLLISVLDFINTQMKSYSFVFYVTHDIVQKIKDHQILDRFTSNINFHLVTDVIEMEDDPLSAIRLKKDSSLVVGIKDVSEKRTDAFISAGNTGALVASANLMISPLRGVDRPALLAVLPTSGKPLAIIDVGGNISCKSRHLAQYAHLGAAYQRCTQGVEVPTIGLLNIGVESKKGTLEHREAYRTLQEQASSPQSKIHFHGNVEGREVFEGKLDVLVTDGFTGNVMLKTSEGVSSFIFRHLTDSEAIKKKFSYEEYPGAIICGVEGVVVKCHGSATPRSFIKSIEGAIQLVKNHLIEKMKEELNM